MNKAHEDLLPILINVPCNQKTWNKWLTGLWQTYEDDGVEYLSILGNRWGEVCGSKEPTFSWVDDLISIVHHVFGDPRPGGYFHGTTACLSYLFSARRYQEILDLLELPRSKWWHYWRYGVNALLAMNRASEALEYTEASRGLNNPDSQIDRVCEDILISKGQHEEAYWNMALHLNWGCLICPGFGL